MCGQLCPPKHLLYHEGLRLSIGLMLTFFKLKSQENF
jgi:hypothetical protein